MYDGKMVCGERVYRGNIIVFEEETDLFINKKLKVQERYFMSTNKETNGSTGATVYKGNTNQRPTIMLYWWSTPT